MMENINVNKNEVKVSNKERRRSFAKVANERVGQTVMQNCGEIAYIVEYVDSKNITVQFKKTGELVKCAYNTFVKGKVKSHFSPTVFGVGITGLEPTRDENGELLDSYICWCDMLKRCYSAKYQQKYPTYIGCCVSEVWLYYSNFKKFYNETYYEVENKTTQLDKDILIKGNKIYSPETCIFVPNFINTLFVKRQNDRGKTPIGTSLIKGGKIRSHCNDGFGRQIVLGSFDDIHSAWLCYKLNKELVIQSVANEYKDLIPKKLYDAMMDYRIEIND